jgi:hypothetical protein
LLDEHAKRRELEFDLRIARLVPALEGVECDLELGRSGDKAGADVCPRGVG